jgi:hypothetical protein
MKYQKALELGITSPKWLREKTKKCPVCERKLPLDRFTWRNEAGTLYPGSRCKTDS